MPGAKIFHFFPVNVCGYQKKPYLCTAIEKQRLRYKGVNAQMAELVDALVSNTNGFTSIPVRSRVWVRESLDNRLIIKAFAFYETY